MSAKPFGRVRRLADGAVFRALLTKGRRQAEGAVTARVLFGDGVGRLGLSIAKRHLRKATARNAMKRIIREAYRARGTALERMDVLFMLTEGSRGREDVRRVPQKLKSADGRSQIRSAVDAVLDRLQSGTHRAPDRGNSPQ
ncbi:MAG: ribonuclease P protein component [Burkholderiales bacterium]|nr:ribonuclease P protein component [Burkholderiales bacterium]